jgi:uncharacterized membrane protein
MSRLIHELLPTNRFADRRPHFVAGIATLSLATFVLAPGDLASKTHMALHGLCAQRPSHSLQIGGSTLPMDSRMTGIYIGAATTVIWLFAAGRLRSTRVPSLPVVSVLVLFVLAMAVDGLNSLLIDLRLPILYEPSNILRIATGLLAGVALGVTLAHLFANSIWARGDGGLAVVTRPVELLAPIGVSAAIAALAFVDFPLLYAPFAFGLLVAAVGVFWLLAIIVLALLSDRGWSCRTWGDLAPVALTAFVAAIVTVGALAVMRLAAEQLLGLPKLT